MENVTRFGLTEMMSVLRDAVRPTREPSSYLNACEVSKYIKNRYGFVKKPSESKVPPIQYVDHKDNIQQNLKLRSTSLNNWKELSTDKSEHTQRTKSLPRHLKANTSKDERKSVNQPTMAEKSNVALLKQNESLKTLASTEMRRTVDFKKWYPNKLSYEGTAREKKKTEKKKLSGKPKKEKLTKVTKQTRHTASSLRKSAKSLKSLNKPKTSKLASLGLKPEPEPRTWIQKNSKSGNLLESFPNKCELLMRKTKEAKAKLIEDLKLIEQRKQIEDLRGMARDYINQHVDELREQRRTNTTYMF